MIRHVYDALNTAAAHVLISVRRASSRYDDCLPSGVEYVFDPEPGAGPLAGLLAGSRASDAPWLLTVACDLPFVTPRVLRWLLDARDPAVDAVISVTPDGQRHPHCAVYRRTPLQAATEALLATDRRSMRALLSQLTVRRVSCPQPPLQNVNRRSDVAV